MIFTEWAQTELKWPEPKSALHMECLGLQVSNFHLFHTMRIWSVVFQMFHILWFPIDSHVKISVLQSFKIWLIVKKGNNLYFPMVANIPIECLADIRWKL